MRLPYIIAATTGLLFGAAIAATDPPRDYPAVVLRVVDGDTFDAEIDLGFGVKLHDRIRLANCNAPEMDTVEGKQAALEAQKVLEGKHVTLLTGRREREKYGRILATVKMPDGRIFDCKGDTTP